MDVRHKDLTVRYDGDLALKDINGQSLLHIMYYAGHCGTPMLERVFLQGNDTKFVNSIDSYGVSNFHMCCSLNNPDLVKVFLDRGVDVNSAISFTCSINPGFTPLHFAVEYNCTEVVELLLKHGADCNKGDKRGSTALHLACEKPDAEDSKIIDMLLEFGASPAAADEKGVTPLHLVFYKVEDLRESIINKFCSKVPRKVNFTDDKGLSHFHIVCTRGDASRVNDFLQTGVAVDSRVASGLYSGYTALHFAVLCNAKHVVELLLQNNAQVNVKTRRFQLTPLHIACKFYMKYSEMDVRCNFNPAKVDWVSRCKDDLAIIELLLRHGAAVDARDSLGKTPLIQTCTVDKIVYSHADYFSNYSFFSEEFRIAQKKIIKILLSHNANINARTEKRQSVLHAVTKSDFLNKLNEDLAEYLIIEGADVNAADAAGLTPLHLAVKFVNATLVKLFLKYQSDVNAEAEYFTTPLEMAIENIEVYSSKPAKDIVLDLLKYGANVNIVKESGRTLLEDAIKNRMTFVVEKLLHNGADMNMNGFRRHSTASFLKEWCRKLKDIELVRVTAYGQIVQIIFIHAQKLMAVGQPIDVKIQTWCIRLLHRLERVMLRPYRRRRTKSHIDFIRLGYLYGECIEELERMHLVKINHSTSLLDVLLLNDAETLSRQIRNSIFVEIMEDQSRFPLYSFLLKRQFNKALERRHEMENAKTSLSYIAGIQFPDPCCDLVLKHLTTKEIVNFNTAVIILESK